MFFAFLLSREGLYAILLKIDCLFNITIESFHTKMKADVQFNGNISDSFLKAQKDWILVLTLFDVFFYLFAVKTRFLAVNKNWRTPICTSANEVEKRPLFDIRSSHCPKTLSRLSSACTEFGRTISFKVAKHWHKKLTGEYESKVYWLILYNICLVVVVTKW